jgi:hypothetical protein
VRQSVRTIVVIASLAAMTGCATTTGPRGSASPLIGAWQVDSVRGNGVGKNLLTFSSDGTFFRSGDTHPVLSGAHGAWKQTAEGEYQATYVAFRFDENRKWIGSNRTQLRIKFGPGPNEFSGTARAVIRDLEEKQLGVGEARLQGKRIEVELQ